MSGVSAYFMNFMKMYEGGVLNGFFAIRPSFPTQDMKLENAVSSYKFINLEIGRGDPAPTGTKVCHGV